MKASRLILTIGACALLLLASAPVWGAKGGKPGKPPPPDEEPPGDTTPVCIDDVCFWFWRWGHLDGPHDSSKALGISRDGKTAVGSTVVVDFQRAWRSDIDWAIATDDAVPPLYNELQVQEDVGVVAPSQFSAAYAASDMTCDSYTYDKSDKDNLDLDWCGSMPVGTLDIGQVSYGIEWLLPVLDRIGEEFEPAWDYWKIPDFGGGISDMKVKDVSADGTILVGTGYTKTGMKAFRADTTVLDDDLVPIPVQLTITEVVDGVEGQTLQSSSAQAVSADGTIITGYGSTKRGNKAFVTTFLGIDPDTGEADFESTILPGIDGGKFAEAYAMTPDGLVIAGRSDSPRGPQACIWFLGDDPETTDFETDVWVVKGLGGLSKKKLDSVATGIAYRPESMVGELIVVGKSQSILYPEEAFVWTGNPVLLPDNEIDVDEFIGYMYDLEYILTKTGAGEASSMGSRWILNEATGISADGDRIVGWGVNPEGGIEAWVVTGFPYDELDLSYEE